MKTVWLPPQDAWTFVRLPGLLEMYDIRPNCVLHVGAHHGEEVAIYKECGFGRIALVECDPQNVMVLDRKFGGDETITVLPYAASTKPGPITLYRSERSVWSSTVNDKKSYLSANNPQEAGTVPALTVAELQMYHPYANPNVLVIDTQGTELDVLKTADLKRVAMIVIEVCHREGDTASFFDDVIAYSEEIGFIPVEEWVHDQSGYNDLVLVREEFVK